MSDILLQVMLSRKRDQSGVLLVRDRTGRVLARFEALGRGSRGAGNTQMLVNGNTPTGTYRASRVIPTASANLNSYGPNGAIVLDPVSGNARAAEKIAGREGLLIHGGSLGGTTYWRGKNELRATHGCIRLRNEDMKRLMNLMFDESLSALQCTPIEVLVTVSDYPVTFDRPSGRMTARVP